METHIAAGEFKAKCLKILDQVHDKNESFVITKRGVPFARMMPLEKPKYISPVGALAGTLIIKGDIISPALNENEWEALN